MAAVEKSTGKDQKIEIKNDKGRLSDDDIKRMVEESERFSAEDEANRLRVEARNSLENYVYSAKTSMMNEPLSTTLSAPDRNIIESNISEAFKWLGTNQMAEKDEYEEKQRGLEAVLNPIFSNAAGPQPKDPASVPTEASAHDEGPKVEEID